MADSTTIHQSLSAAVVKSRRPKASADYLLLGSVSASFIGLSKTAQPALILPLPTHPDAVGRSAAGFALTNTVSVKFEDEGRRWSQPAAVLECREPAALESFSVLAYDVAVRACSAGNDNDWGRILQVVEEWYELLARRKRLPIESEVGLWGEIWFILQGKNPTPLIEGWLGPDSDAVDFMVGGRSVEIKTSRAKGRHFVSQSQLVRPKGDTPSYLLSIWVGADPTAGERLPSLVERLRVVARDPAAVARLILMTGYSEADREEYQTAFRVLETPSWFPLNSVPRVTRVDAGVSNLRYVIDLDVIPEIDIAESRDLCQHFFGRDQWSLETSC